MLIPGPLTDLGNQRLGRCVPGTSTLLGMRTPVVSVKPTLNALRCRSFKNAVSDLSDPLKWGNQTVPSEVAKQQPVMHVLLCLRGGGRGTAPCWLLGHKVVPVLKASFLLKAVRALWAGVDRQGSMEVSLELGPTGEARLAKKRE